MRLAFVAVSLALGACGVAAEAPPRAMPDWMSGYWLACDGEAQTAETWIGAGGATLLGANLSGQSGYEFLRIAASENGQIVYYSMPGGRSPPTEFVMTHNSDQRAVFENPAHDFPKRITYARVGDVMTARIDGGDGAEQGIAWRFERATLDAHCPS